MKPERLINELETELGKLGIHVRLEKGNFKGGWCVVNDEEVIMINKRHSAEAQFAVLAEAIRNVPLDSVYIKPKVREALEEQWRSGTRRGEAQKDQEGAEVSTSESGSDENISKE